MTKAELVSAIAQQTGISKVEITAILEAQMEVIQNTMASGENVYLRGFGSFVMKTRKEKLARNIRAKTTVLVPEHQIPTFKPSPEFIDKLK